jgi:hypothetical protein
MIRFLFVAVLLAICAAGCVPPRALGGEPPTYDWSDARTMPPKMRAAISAMVDEAMAANDAAAALALAAAMPTKAPAECPCGCPCSTGAACTCPPGECRCAACPGKVTLAELKERAMADNKRLVVWTGTTGHAVADCLTCRDETMTAPGQVRPFVSVGVPSANGLVWWQFPASVPDAALRTVRTDGVHDLLPAATQPSPSDWRYWQTAYPAPYLNAAPLPQPATWAPQAMSFAPMGGGMAGCSN